MFIQGGSNEFLVSGSPHSWIVPAGVYWIWITGIAGGGGGGGSSTIFSHGGAGAGGGSGESIDGFIYFVTPGDTITVIVGAGGQGGRAGATATQSIVNRQEGQGGSVFDGFGGGQTLIDGVIRLCGGFGGSAGTSPGHSGMGGGPGAGIQGGNPGNVGTTGGLRISGFGGDGFFSDKKYLARYYSGSGGGAGGANSGGAGQPGGTGGAFAPYLGGASGTASGADSGGGGGGSSRYGRGAAGGNSGAAAGLVSSTSYGAGGAGGGGWNGASSGVNSDAFQGSTGGDGYVLFTYFIIS